MAVIQTTNVRTETGNRIVVQFGGTQIGLVQSVRMSDSYGLEDVTEIGNIHVIEHVPTKATHALSVSMMKLKLGAMRDLGIAPENGDISLLGNVLDIVAYSKDTGKLLRAYRSCSYDSGDSEVIGNRIVMVASQWKALDVSGLGL